MPLQSTPGERYACNDFGYSLPGMIVEKVNGRKYEEVLTHQIPAPPGMTETGYDWRSRITANRA
ncbi:MAG: serine hydrolase [Vicinamibacterales bacterium]